MRFPWTSPVRLFGWTPNASDRLLLGAARAKPAWVLTALLCGLVAAVFEGGTFGVVLLALKVVSDGTESAVQAIDFAPAGLRDFAASQSESTLFIILIVAAVVLQAIRSTLTYLGQSAVVLLGSYVQGQVLRKVYAQIMSLSFGCASRYKTGDLADVVIRPSTAANELIVYLNQVLVAVLTSLGYIILLLFLSVPLTAAAVVVFGLTALGQKRLVQRIRHWSNQVGDTGARLTQEVVEGIHALRTIHIFSRQKASVRQLDGLIGRVTDLTTNINRAISLIGPMGEVLTVSAVGGFLILGVFLLSKSGGSAVPELLIFTAVVNRLSGRVNAVPANTAEVAKRLGQIRRLESILRTDDKEFLVSTDVPLTTTPEEVTFENVTFRYPGSSVDAVRDISFSLPRGSVTALVGTSGAGKSTIVDLLARLYPVTSGAINVDGVNIERYSVQSWSEQLGVVSQDPFLFSATILENIRFGSPTASDADVIEAARVAHAHEFIVELPDGYHTITGERGFGLSGGQRQRLALARAVLRQPNILVLDEATSALDSVSERLIQEALEVFGADRAVLVVAHRLSTIVRADQILLLEDGNLVEQGTHGDLIMLRGRYTRFWNLQSHMHGSQAVNDAMDGELQRS